MLRVVIAFIFLGICHTSYSQSLLTWDDFADVNFEPKYNAQYDAHFLMPTFGKKIKSYEGKQVKITGFFLDLAGTGEIYLVSANPMASCFFCGAAGPETVIEVAFKERPSFKTDQVVQIIGQLSLNADDVGHCNYIMSEASGKLIR
ncbi:MAG: hypothetical protein AAGF77_07545 [Bacteroidota bacterium]